MVFLETANCTAAPDFASSDAGVAGAGILLSFMVTAYLAIFLSASVIWADLDSQDSTIRRKLLNGYSDSQILQGIGIRSVGLAKMNTLVPYHFFLIWMLSLLSMATHNATLLALVRDYRRDWVLRWMRQFLMFVNLALSSVLGVFVLQAISKGLGDHTLPIACVWQVVDDTGAAADVRLSYVGTIVVMAGNAIIFALATWYLHSRDQRFQKLVQTTGLLLMGAIAAGAAVRIGLLSQAFGHPSVKLADMGEKTWGFGQLLSMLLLLFPLVSVVEIYRGEIEVARSVEDKTQRPYHGELLSNPLHHDGFQSVPFFGSRASLSNQEHEGPGNEP